MEYVPDIKDVVKADDNLETSRVTTDDNIIDVVLQKEDSDECTEGTVPAKLQLIHKTRMACKYQ
jgi:hypothetical protein